MVNHPKEFINDLNPWQDLKDWSGKNWSGSWFAMDNKVKPVEENDGNITRSDKARIGDCDQ